MSLLVVNTNYKIKGDRACPVFFLGGQVEKYRDISPPQILDIFLLNTLGQLGAVEEVFI